VTTVLELSAPSVSFTAMQARRRRLARLQRAEILAKVAGDRNRQARVRAAYQRLTFGETP
jgi:hypothetical protein